MTDKPVLPRSLAFRDVEKAVDHYRDEGGEAVALSFIQALQHAYRRIARHPAAGSARYAYELDLPGLRCWPVRGFPYLIFYLEGPSRIDVWRVLSAKRDIPGWLREPNDGL